MHIDQVQLYWSIEDKIPTRKMTQVYGVVQIGRYTYIYTHTSTYVCITRTQSTYFPNVLQIILLDFVDILMEGINE